MFFNHLDVCFSLPIMSVHSPATCANYNNFSMNCCTWLRFLISSPHHSYCTSIISQFVVNNNFLFLSLLCYCWSSFRSHGSHLDKVFFLIFCWLFANLFFFGLCLLVFLFAFYFSWMGSPFSHFWHSLLCMHKSIPKIVCHHFWLRRL